MAGWLTSTGSGQHPCSDLITRVTSSPLTSATSSLSRLLAAAHMQKVAARQPAAIQGWLCGLQGAAVDAKLSSASFTLHAYTPGADRGTAATPWGVALGQTLATPALPQGPLSAEPTPQHAGSVPGQLTSLSTGCAAGRGHCAWCFGGLLSSSAPWPSPFLPLSAGWGAQGPPAVVHSDAPLPAGGAALQTPSELLVQVWRCARTCAGCLDCMLPSPSLCGTCSLAVLPARLLRCLLARHLGHSSPMHCRREVTWRRRRQPGGRGQGHMLRRAAGSSLLPRQTSPVKGCRAQGARTRGPPLDSHVMQLHR